MTEEHIDQKLSPLQRWLPYAVDIVGVIISIIIWRQSIISTTPAVQITLAEKSHPWIILAFGISLSFLAGLTIRLVQLTRQRKRSFDIINEHFKQEMADRIHAEEIKQKLEKALLQGQKLQAIGTLAGGIAHDFNNLLYAIIGYVGMTRDDLAPDTLAHKNLGKVLEACKRGQELISRILTFSRRQHHDVSPICLHQAIEGVLDLLRPTIPSSVNLVLDTNVTECKILGNQTQLHQVLVNIINNAVDAMDGEGTITIAIHRVPSHDKLLQQFPKITPGNYCKIDITDTGHGMDQATAERIFEPFFTTKEVGKGTGLGLATVHSIIQEHQGEVVVKSQLGHGTTFTLLLPECVDQKENVYGENIVS